MRRNWNLIEKILTEIADEDFQNYLKEYSFNEFIAEHFDMLEEAGLIEFLHYEEEDGVIESARLTWKGQNLLEILDGNLIYEDENITKEFRNSLM